MVLNPSPTLPYLSDADQVQSWAQQQNSRLIQELSAHANYINTLSLTTASGANPTVSIGLTAANGTSGSFIRSDGAPALSQAIVPTWSGTHTFNNGTHSALFTGGSVGVGTSTPFQLLDVHGGNIMLGPANGTTGLMLQGAGGGNNLSLWNDSSNFIHLKNQNTTYLLLNESGGNVGVGVASPAQALDVAGSITSSSGYRVGNAATSGNVLRGNGSDFVSAKLDFSDLSGSTATGHYDTRTLAAAATIAGSVNYVRTAGYATVGDYGEALYKKVGGTTLGGFQSADGQWWGIAQAVVTPQMFGGFPGGACTTPIQNAIDFANGRSGGIVFIPIPGSYFATSLVQKGSVRLMGCSRNGVLIDGSSSNTNTLTFDATCTYASMENMTITGYTNVAATTNAVTIAQGVPVVLRDCSIFGGSAGLFTQGVDGYVNNCFIMGYVNGIVSNGANWYERVKIDNSGAVTPVGGFLQGSYYTTGVAENTFIACDFSGPFTTYSIKIDDAGQHSSIAKFGSGCVISDPIIINSAKGTMFIGCEFGSASFTVGTNPTAISACFALTTIVVSGAGKALSGNIGPIS